MHNSHADTRARACISVVVAMLQMDPHDTLRHLTAAMRLVWVLYTSVVRHESPVTHNHSSLRHLQTPGQASTVSFFSGRKGLEYRMRTPQRGQRTRNMISTL